MKIDQLRALDPTRVIVLDTETTGFNAYDNDEILSLSIVDLNGTVLFDELVKPEHRKRWPKAQEINGITPEMVKDKQPLSAYREQLQELWKRIDLVVGYNVEFDSNFIYASGLCLSPYVEEFDVMKEFAPIWGKWDARHNDYRWAKLAQCAAYYKVGNFEQHTSLGDTEATRLCFLALINDEKYISSCRVSEGLGSEEQPSATDVSNSGIKPIAETEQHRPDALGKILTVLLVLIAVFGFVNLFIEWQMSVTCVFAFVFVLLLKAYHDGKRNRKES